MLYYKNIAGLGFHMQYSHIAGNQIYPERERPMFRVPGMLLAIIFYLLLPITLAHAMTGDPKCNDGSDPIHYGASKGKVCTSVVDLTNALKVINWATQSPPRFYTQGPGYRQANSCNLSYPDTATRTCGTGPYCASYDCSSLASYVATQVPGFTGPANGNAVTCSEYDQSTPRTGHDPVLWCFGYPGEGGCGPSPDYGHVYVMVGGHVGNAHGCHAGMPEIDDQPDSGFDCRVPQGLAYLSDSCVCGGDYQGSGGAGSCSGVSYLSALGQRESGNNYKDVNSYGCAGRWQFCPISLGGPGWSKYNDNVTGWLSDTAYQDSIMDSYTCNNWSNLVAVGMDKYIGKTITVSGNTFKITQAALLGGAHLKGVSSVVNLIVNGIDSSDGYGTNTSDYMKNFSPDSVDVSCSMDQGCAEGTGSGDLNPSPISIPPLDIGLSKQKLTDYLDEWWNSEFEPALKDMTAQLYAYRVFITQQLGRIMDAQDINRTAHVIGEERITSQQSNTPNEETCVAGSYPPELSRASRTSEALTRGLKMDLDRRAANAVQKAPYKGPPPAEDQKNRWNDYCNEFQDPSANAGMTGCAKPDAGPVVNGDIRVESLLLKDTINMQDPDEYKAAQALLRNLVQPNIQQKIPDTVIDTPAGHEYIIKQQHIEAANSIAEAVVADIISRRASMDQQSSAATHGLIRQIREKVGIDPNLISDNPSYNEIMLTLTKERFFDPEYFTHLANNVDAIKQEQTALDAYTTIQMQDIYRLQEQINALLAARASLKYAPDQNPNFPNSAPIK